MSKPQWQALHQQRQLWLAALKTWQLRFICRAVRCGKRRRGCGAALSPRMDRTKVWGWRHSMAAHARWLRDQQRLAQILRKAMAAEQRLQEDVQHRPAAVADPTTLQRRADRLLCCPELQHSGITSLLVADPMGGPEELVSGSGGNPSGQCAAALPESGPAVGAAGGVGG